MERERSAKRHNGNSPQSRVTGERVVDTKEVAATGSVSGVASRKRKSSRLRLHLNRIPLYFRPGFTYTGGGLGLSVAFVAFVFIYAFSQTPTDPDRDKYGNFVEVQVAALFTLATFVPVIIAVFLQGKASMRIDRGRGVWRSSLIVATVFYALVLLALGAFAIWQLATGVPEDTLLRGINVSGMFLVIMWLPVLILTVVYCSGVKFTSKSARELVKRDLTGELQEKDTQHLRDVIKDLRDAALAEYGEGNRRAVRQRLLSLAKIAECGDPHLADSSLEEVSYLASEMVRDRELALEALTHIHKSTVQDSTKVSELMSIWADAVGSGASPKVEEKCASLIKEILRENTFNFEELDLLRKLQDIVVAYDSNAHEEIGLIRTFKTFYLRAPAGELAAIVDQLSRGSEKTTEAFAEVLCEVQNPVRSRKDLIRAFTASALNNAQGDVPVVTGARNSLRRLACQGERHREAVALATSYVLEETVTRVDNKSVNGALLAAVLQMDRDVDSEDLNLQPVSREETADVLEKLMRKLANVSPLQCQSAVISLRPVLRQQGLSWDEDSQISQQIVVRVLTKAWRSHIDSKTDVDQDKRADLRSPLDLIQDYARTIPRNDEMLSKVIPPMYSALEITEWPLEEELAAFNIFLKSSDGDHLVSRLRQAYFLVEKSEREGRPLATVFKQLQIEVETLKELVEGTALLLSQSDHFVVSYIEVGGKFSRDSDGEFEDSELEIDSELPRVSGKTISIGEAQDCLFKVLIAAILSKPSWGRKVLAESQIVRNDSKFLRRLNDLLDEQYRRPDDKADQLDIQNLLIGVRLRLALWVQRTYAPKPYLGNPRFPLEEIEKQICDQFDSLLDPLVPPEAIGDRLLTSMLLTLLRLMEFSGERPSQRLSNSADLIVKNLKEHERIRTVVRKVFSRRLQESPTVGGKSPCIRKILLALDAADRPSQLVQMHDH